MQYVDYEYAKDHGIVGLAIYGWMKLTPQLTLKSRGGVIKGWRNGEYLLNIGEPLPDSSNPEAMEEWARTQIQKRFHKKQYLRRYLERNLFIEIDY